MSQELRLPWDESYFHTWDTNMSFSSMNSFSNMIKNFAAERCKISFSAVSMLFNILEKKKICKKCAK